MAARTKAVPGRSPQRPASIASIWRTCMRRRPATSFTDQPFASRTAVKCVGFAMVPSSGGVPSSSSGPGPVSTTGSIPGARSPPAAGPSAPAVPAGRSGASPSAILGSSFASLGSPSPNLGSVTELFLCEQARFRRRGETAPQLRGEAVELDGVAPHARDPQTLPERRRRRLVGLQQALGIEVGALAVTAAQVDVGEVVERHRIGGLDLEGAVQVGERLLLVPELAHADAGVVQGPGRRLVQRIAGGLLEIRQ